MLKILLADDEPVIAKGIARLIDWERLGGRIEGIAFDGREALSMLADIRPDILVTDICMPGLDGVALLKHVHEQGLPTRVIFISGFQEFRYAQDAVRYGAVGYLLKPVDRASLEEAVRKAINQIDSMNSARRLESVVSDYEREARSAKVDRYLSDLVQGRIQGDMPDTAPLEALRVGDGAHVVIAVHPEEPVQANAAANSDDREGEDEAESLRRFAIANLVEEHADVSGPNIRFWKDGCLYVILRWAAGDTGADSRAEEMDSVAQAGQNEAIALAGRIRTQALERLQLPLSIAVGDAVRGLAEIHRSYETAREALSAGYFFRDVVLTAALLSENQRMADDLRPAQQELVRAFLAYDGERVRHASGELMSVIHGVSLWNKGAAISLCMTSTVMLGKELSESGIQLGENARIGEGRLELLRAFPDYEALREWMVGHWVHAFEEMLNYSKGRESIWIRKVKDHIDANYADSITLETVAEIACMNPHYFSTFFRKQTGEKFKDYLTKVRMENAVRLLMSTDDRVYEIAEQVGFNDYRHFSEVFRKIYGSSPSEYKAFRLGEPESRA